MMPARGDMVCYRAIAGDVYDAVVTGVREGGFVDVEVLVPGTERRVGLSAVRFHDGPAAWARVWPRDG